MLRNPAAAAVQRIAKPKPDKARFERLFAFQCRSLGLPVFEQQFLFAKAALGRQWAADFYFAKHRLIVELQGAIWQRGGGGHSHPTGILKDMEKHNAAVLLGLSVLAFTTDQVTSGEAVAFTQKVLTAGGWQANH